jgi:DNA phosphorothioation-associated putative methyltransferase
LRGAWDLTERALIVSVLVAGQETDAHALRLGDGFLTKANTFQKFYAPGELEDLLENTLETHVITIALGICVAFRDPDEAEMFEASRSRRRMDWTQIATQLQFTSPESREKRRVDRYELHKELLDAFWNCLLELGRIPEPGEFDRLHEVKKINRGIKNVVAQLIARNGPVLWEMAKQTRSEDVLVYLAMTNFRKKFLRREIPLRIKHDIRAFFGDIPTAQARARELLFAAGDPGEVALAVEPLRFGVHDREEQQFTFHRSMLNRLPAILRVYVQCAAIRYGNPEEADLIKIHVRSGKLTFLHYDNFEDSPEPILRTRIKVNLRTQFVQVFDHTQEQQPLTDKRSFLLGN